MKKVPKGLILEWLHRPLTEVEAWDLCGHLEYLYEALQEAELLFNAAKAHGDVFKAALSSADRVASLLER